MTSVEGDLGHEVVADPFGPYIAAGADRHRRRVRRRRVAAAGLCGVLLVGGLAVTTADVRVAQGRARVVPAVTDARLAAAAVPTALTAASDLPALRETLRRLAASGRNASAGSGGPLWAVAAHVGTDPGRTAALRRESARLRLLADAATPLAAALGPLETGDTDPDRLDDLARGISRYTTAAVRAGDAGARPLVRPALAAGLLTGLTGGDGAARTWSVCPARGRCSRVSVTDGVVTATAPRAAADITVRSTDAVTDADTLLGPAEPGAARRLDARALYRLLLGDPGRVHSAVAAEQAALDTLARTGSY